MTSPQILLLFVVMGGVIAYLGDWLGRKMGKKRLRIGKLRPRHTATFFTVLMGMLIPLATTYGIVTQSAAVRQWIVEGPELARRQDRLKSEIEENQIQLAKLENDAEASKTRLASVEAMRASAAKARDTAVRERNAERGKLAAARLEIRSAEMRERDIKRRVDKLRANEKVLTDSVTDLRSELKASQSDLETSRREATRLYNETEGLKRNSVELAQQIQDLEAERNSLVARADKARSDAEAAEADVQRYFDRILDLRRTISSLEGTLAGAAEGLEAVRTSSVVYRQDEELSRLAIPAGLTREQAREKISQVVRIADVAAKERGVRPDANGKAAALGDRIRRMPDGTYMTITVQDQENAFVNEIAGNKQELVLIATSFYNYFSRDDFFVPLNLNIYPNKIVFDQGETVAQTTIDGSATEEDILNAIILFLRTGVRSSAEDAGMIPVQGPDVSIGEITYTQMIDLVGKIKQRGSQARVIAEAARATKSSESLQLRFRVQSP